MNDFRGFGQGNFGTGGFGGRGFGKSPFGSSENIWEGIKKSFRNGSDMTKLIYINIAVYLAIKLTTVVGFLVGTTGLSSKVIQLLAVPSDTIALLEKPWSVFSYMFVHEGFMHLLFNMLWLFWFGQLFQQFIGRTKLSAVYVLGGLSGAALYILSYNIFPAFQLEKYSSIAIGASASVMAIVFAVAFYSPNYKLHLVFIGPVKLIHIALFSIALDVLSLPAGNAGGHIAHLGGAFYGYLFALNYKKNKDITAAFVNLYKKFVGLFSHKPKMKVKYKNTSARNMTDREYNSQKKQNQEKVNQILDKISKSGYDSLTSEEKEILFRSGRG